MRCIVAIVLLVCIRGAICVGQEKNKLTYPLTKTDNVVDILHGIKIVDPYRWLEDGKSDATMAWVEEQNKLTQTVLDKTPGRAKIRERLSSLLEIGSLGVPKPAKGRYFFTKREGTQNQPVLFVREGLHGKDRVLIDINELAKDGTIALDWWYPSHDGKLLAYGLSKDGSEFSVLRVRDVDTGKDLPDTIERTRACSLAWHADNKGFFYTRYPAVGSVPKGKENYNRHVYNHDLGDDPKQDRLVFGKDRDPEDWPSVALSPDGKWLAVNVHQGWAKSEVYVQNTLDAFPRWDPIAEKIPALFDLTVRNDRFYLHTNHEAPRYRLFEIDPKIGKLKWSDRSLWKEILPQGSDKLESFAAVGDYLIAEYMHDATNQLKILDRTGKLVENVKLPTLGTISGLGSEDAGNELLFGFQSFAVAPSIYHINLKTRKQELWGRVQSEIKANDYVVEQVKYKSKDGTEVPMFLTYKKGIKKDGTNPTLLYGYGGFNISLTPTFATTRFLFLEKGGVLAIANLRGGGEYGEDWHRAGMLEQKQNTFDDFVAAAEWLVANKVTRKDKLAIQGGSNGGLLMGAVTTQRPELFQAVVCQVPLLDMTRYHKFLIARLWMPEYGNPDKAADFKWIYAYSPYQKVKAGTAYPATLITTAASDSRVDPLHARKMAARLQAASSGNGPILLRQETRAGHGAGKPRGLVLDEQTDVWSFVFSQLGVR
ncbi:MAG: S9 family peptidase [Gemmataceae bacterium]|nr:S9 family peptidase [Gemmataceae bacterium]